MFSEEKSKDKWKYFFQLDSCPGIEIDIINWVPQLYVTYQKDTPYKEQTLGSQQREEYQAAITIHAKTLKPKPKGAKELATIEAHLARYLMEQKIPFCITKLGEHGPIVYEPKN